MEKLAQFQVRVENFSLEQLYEEKNKCEKSLANMIELDSECLLKLEFILQLIKNKESERSNG